MIRMIRMGTVFSVLQGAKHPRIIEGVTWATELWRDPTLLIVRLMSFRCNSEQIRKKSVSVMCCCICPWHFWSPWSAAWKPFHLSRCPSHHYVLSSPIISRTKKHIILLVVTCLIMLYLLLIVFWLRAVVHRSCNQLWRQQTSPHPHVKVCIHRMSAVFM